MRKRILTVALIGLIVMSLLGLASLMTGNSVAAGSLPAPYAKTLRYGDSRCVILLWADFDTQHVWGEVKTWTANTVSCTEVDMSITSLGPEAYYTMWETVGYPGEWSTIDVDGESTLFGHVDVIWRVYSRWYPYPVYVETVSASYQVGHWDQGGVQGLVGDAATGYPLPYATVIAKQGNAEIQKVEADCYGRYYIGLEDGTYSVTASHIGFYDKTYTVVVSNHHFTTRNFQLTPMYPGPI